MSPRRSVTDALERIAFASELCDEPNASSWTAAAWAVRQVAGDLAAMLADGSLASVRGVGPRTIEVVADVLAGKEPDVLTALAARVPAGLFELRRVRGLGPKKIKALHRELGITSLAELEQACRENRLVSLAGFGPKTQATVIEQLQKLAGAEGRFRRDEAKALLDAASAAIALAVPGAAIERAGDLRRGLDVVERLSLVVVVPELAAAPALPVLDARVELVVTTPSRRGVALLRATGPRAHLADLEARALALGLALGQEQLVGSDGREIACADEESVASALRIVLEPAERRGAGPPIPSSGAGPSPLVSRRDLRGALHNHTTASDGTASLADMRAAASAWGLEYLGVSEHSEAAFYARGLDAVRLRAQRGEIAEENRRASGAVLLTGVESDILDDGALDVHEEILAELEVVVASVHKRLAHGKDAMTARLVRAVRSPYTDVLGHPTGRLLFGRPSAEIDIAALLDACAEVGCAIELNGSPQRLDLAPASLAMAKERGVLVSIAADAHATSELEHLEHGIAVARHAGLRPEDVLNTRSLPELRVWLAGRRARRGLPPRPSGVG